MTAIPIARSVAPVAAPMRPPPLQSGDRLTRDEFERRYDAMPPGVKAELVEGVVYVASPVSDDFHAAPHFDLIGWLGLYRFAMRGLLMGGDNGTLRLDLDNEPQPDAYLRIAAERGGRARRDKDGYIVGAPELVAEIAASSAAYDLHAKLNAYRKNGVAEYVVWRTYDAAIDWFFLNEGRYDPLPRDSDGVYRSRVLPGLWLDPAALISGDVETLAIVAQKGIASPAHAAFVERLRGTAKP